MPRPSNVDKRDELTPHMRSYEECFSDRGAIRWLPYLMYFHPVDYSSSVVNTDSLGFRLSVHEGKPLGVDQWRSYGAVNVLGGSSTSFGIGASCDAATLPSRLNFHSGEEGAPWVNMGGRSHNSAQELLLHALYRHRLPTVERIVLFSGFNDLGLARLPVSRKLEGGAFFMCNTFFERLTEADEGLVSEDEIPDLAGQVEYAAALVLRHLGVWRALAVDAGAELTFVLQPLSTWIRDLGTDEEEELFAYLDARGDFGDTYGEILRPEVGRRYSQLLRDGCERIGVEFTDMTPLLASSLGPTDWMFVDRIHFTDFGYDLVARLLLSEVLAEESPCPR
jgi:hypothetical protein